MKTLLTLILFFSTSAFAAFSGHWVVNGGTISDVSGKKTPCSSIDIVLKQEPGKLTLVSYSAKCPSLDTDWGPNTMLLQNGKVLNSDGDEIGTIQGDDIETQEAENGVNYILNFKLGGDAKTPTLDCVYGVQNFVGSMSIEGTLARVP